MIIPYVKLSIAALLPVLMSVLFYVLSKKSKAFAKLPFMAQQIIIGIAFGALACVGTHWGVAINGAMINTRDAAVLIAGLMFGSPAGIIAGIIGGVERYLATAIWGIGEFTVVACSVSTFLAGLYAAALRRFMFDNKKPGWLISFAIGIIMEVFHLTMVFVTNLHDTERAMGVVKACTVPMLTANAVAVMLSAIILTILAREKRDKSLRTSISKISQTIQRELLITVACTFVIIFVFVAMFQTGAAESQADTYLKIAIEEVTNDINDTSDSSILRIAKEAAGDYKGGVSLKDIVTKYEVADAYYIDSKGIITDASESKYVGYNMASAKQSAEFLVILEGEESYVQPFRKMGYDNKTLRKYAGIAFDDGFFQIGYDVDSFQNIIDDSIIDITKNRHVGETGYTVILDDKYKPVSVPDGFDITELDSQSDILNASKEGETFVMTLGKDKVFARATRAEGYAIISIFPESEAYESRTTALYVNSFIEILVFALMFAFIYFVIKHAVVDQIKKINNSLAKITSGNLDETVNVRSSQEFASLSDDINTTVTALKGYIAEAEHRIEKELEFAHTIQHSALPMVHPAYSARDDFDIFASMDAAKEVGGDFYDFYLNPVEKKLCVLIADVSGKGIPAAMFMMRAKTLLKSLTETGLPVNEVFESANNTLCAGNDADMFVTAWEGIIDLENKTITYACAGHNPPAIRRKDGTFEYLNDKPGFVLAGMEGIPYKKYEISFDEGDTLYLYTDGVTEAVNNDEDMFGEERVLKVLNDSQDKTAEGLCTAVKKAVFEFADGAPQFDDITMLCVKLSEQSSKQVLKVDALTENLDEVMDFVGGILDEQGCPMKTKMQFDLAVEEIFVNIANYAYGDSVGKAEIEAEVNDGTVTLTFIDSGMPFNPLTKKDPDITLSAEKRAIGGLGIFLVKKYMDDVSYDYADGKNMLTVTKKISG